MTSNLNHKARLNADLHQKMVDYMARKCGRGGKKVSNQAPLRTAHRRVASVARPATGKNEAISSPQKATDDKNVTKTVTVERASSVSGASTMEKVEKGNNDFERVEEDGELQEYEELGEEPEEEFVLIEEEYDEFEMVD